MGKAEIVILLVAAVSSGIAVASQPVAIEAVLKNVEGKITAAVRVLKEIPAEINIFFAQTERSLAEQRAIASSRTDMIKELLEAGGASPDYGRILQLTSEILLHAPDTEHARIAHWNIHELFLTAHNPWGARDALMTYLDKYDVDNTEKREAFNKLTGFAADDREWDIALYFSEKGLAHDPGSPAGLLNKARALVNLGFLPEGKDLFHRIQEDFTGSSEAGLARVSLKELEQADFGPELLTGYRSTMETMRKIGAAAAMYFVEYMAYPQTVNDLHPMFMDEPADKDTWGGEFILKYDRERDRFLIGSGGSDGVFDGFTQEGFYVDLPGKDIIFSAGDFVYAPQMNRP